jgi:hypothetical protein
VVVEGPARHRPRVRSGRCGGHRTGRGVGAGGGRACGTGHGEALAAGVVRLGAIAVHKWPRALVRKVGVCTYEPWRCTTGRGRSRRARRVPLRTAGSRRARRVPSRTAGRHEPDRRRTQTGQPRPRDPRVSLFPTPTVQNAPTARADVAIVHFVHAGPATPADASHLPTCRARGGCERVRWFVRARPESSGCRPRQPRRRARTWRTLTRGSDRPAAASSFV